MNVRVRPERRLNAEELMLLTCGIGEDSWESFGLQGDPPVNPKGNQPCIFVWRSDAEAEVPILWPHDVKSWLTGKDPDAGKDWRQEEEGMTEDEMVGWRHQLNWCKFEQAPGNDEEQGNLTCYGNGVTKSPTWLSNWTTRKG